MYSLHYKPSNGQPPLELTPADGPHFDVEPLSHAALAAYVQPEPAVHITLKNAKVIGAEIPPGQTYTARMLITSKAGEPLYGLVESGWIPFPFMSGDVAFLDRNVVSKIERLQVGQTRVHGMPVDPQFDISFAGRLVSPLPYVLEGNLRRTQTFGEIQKCLERATKALRRVLPDAHALPMDAVRLRGLHGLLDDLARFQRKVSPFLREVCPSVAQPAGQRQQVEVERKVLRVAKERGISPVSFVVLAVLSCLYDNIASPLHPKVFRAGRAIVKPKPQYSEADAYAALSDLLFLELAASMKGHGLAQRPVFYTHDIGLAAFWSALSPRKFSGNGRGGASGNFTLSPSLFPALNDDQCTALLDRLAERDGLMELH